MTVQKSQLLNTLTHVTNEDGDYEALYINGILHDQQTHIPKHVLKEVTEANQPFKIVDLEVTAAWIEDEGGTYPDKLSDIPPTAISQ